MEQQPTSICLICHEVSDIKDICGFSNGNVCKPCVSEIVEKFITQIEEIQNMDFYNEPIIEYYESDESDE